MKLLYATSIQLPSKLANRLQVTAMAEAFGSYLDENFVLGLNGEYSSVRYYKVHTAFSPFLAFEYFWYCIYQDITHIYCREEKLAAFLLPFCKMIGVPLIFEAHTVVDSALFRFVIKHANSIVAISDGLAKDLGRKCIVLRDGFDDGLFGKKSRESLRKEFGFEGRTVAYVGSIGQYHSWKGVDTFLEASKILPELSFVLAGGERNEIAQLKKLYPTVRFLSHIPHEKAIQVMEAADVVVLPNKKGNPIPEKYTSPLKLFEYLASGAAIVASDLPSIREVVSESEVTFFEAGDVESLAEAIKSATPKPNDVKRFTWKNRAFSFLSGLRNGPSYEYLLGWE